MPGVLRSRRNSGLVEPVRQIAVDAIDPSPYQPRREFDEEGLRALAASIREHGLLQPLVVRPRGERFELIAGERRLRACRLLGMEEAPARVRHLDDSEAAEAALIENLQREDLHFLEEAEGFRRLIQEFGMTQEALAERLGLSQSTIANKLRLLRLPEAVLAEVRAKGLSERHARILLSLPDAGLQAEAVEAFSRGLSVRQAEEWAARRQRAPKRKPTIRGVYKDIRIIENGVRQLVEQLANSGVRASWDRRESEGAVEVVIRIETGAAAEEGR